MLAIGMPVMLLKNQAHALGIANGTIAILRQIVLHPDDQQTTTVKEKCGAYTIQKQYLTHLPLYICVEPIDNLGDLANAHPPAPTGLANGNIAAHIPAGWIPIFPESVSLTLRDKQKTTFSVHRTPFPITGAFALTYNKVQSQTLKGGAIVDLVRAPRVPTDPAAVYVMLSRVRELNKLWILRDFSLDVLNSLQDATRDQLKEMEDLEARDKEHKKRFCLTHSKTLQ